MSLSFERNRIVALALLAGVSLVLQAPIAAAQQPPAPATADAEPSASHLAAARELVLATGMKRTFDAAIPDLLNKIGDSYRQTEPGLLPDLVPVLNTLKTEFASRTDELVDKAAHIYAKLLTEEQIHATVAFFTSDAGKKYIEVQPIFFNATINAMQDWHDKVSQEIIQRMRDEMKKKGHTL
ncbi:MAG: DUF2059 domain-containing protein [Methylovirgula sp.]